MGFPARAEPGLIPTFQGSFRVQTGRRTSEGSQLSRGCDRARRGGQPLPWGRWGGGPRGSPGEGGAAPSCSASLLAQQLQAPSPVLEPGRRSATQEGLEGGSEELPGRPPPPSVPHFLFLPLLPCKPPGPPSRHACHSRPVAEARLLQEPCPGLLSKSGDLDTKLPRYLSQPPPLPRDLSRKRRPVW